MKVSLAAVRLPHWKTIVLTLVAAIFLTLLPSPDFLRYAKPDWIGLVMIYWVLHLPRHLGVFFGWSLGLLHDILSFSLFGMHALGKALMATIVNMGADRIKRFNILKQMLLVFILQSINVGIIIWLDNLTSGAPIRLVYWQSALSSALLWPIVSVLLGRLDPFKA